MEWLDSTEAEASPTHHIPLIGQERVLSVALSSLEHAVATGRPTFVCIEGDQGSGKTHALRHLAKLANAHRPPLRVSYNRCREGSSYGPFASTLARRFDVRISAGAPKDDTDPELVVRGNDHACLTELETQWASAVAKAWPIRNPADLSRNTALLAKVAGIPFNVDPEIMRGRGGTGSGKGSPHEQSCRAFRRFVEWDAFVDPWVILVDDAHFCSEEAWDLVDHLLEAQAPVALIFAGSNLSEQVRPRLRDGTHYQKLGPLNAADIGELLVHLVPGMTEPQQSLVKSIEEKSHGSPGAVCELVKAAIENGLLVDLGEGPTLDLSRATAEGIALAPSDTELDGLSADALCTLQRGAVVGERFWDGAVLACACAEDGGSDFGGSHSVLEAMTVREAAVARHLDKLCEKGFIEEHNSSSLPGCREYSFCQSSLRETLYRKTATKLQVTRHGAVARFMELMDGLPVPGGTKRLAHHFEQARDWERSADYHLRAADEELRQRRTRNAVRHCEKALALLPHSDLRGRINAYELLGRLFTSMARYEEATQALEKMSALAYRVAGKPSLGSALLGMGIIEQMLGNDKEAEANLERALALMTSAEDARGIALSQCYLSRALLRRGDIADAAERADIALTAFQDLGDVENEASACMIWCEIEMARGRVAEAFAAAERARELLLDSENLTAHIASALLLGEVSLKRGELRSAQELFKSALALSEELMNRHTVALARVGLAESLLQGGYTDRARGMLRMCLQDIQMFGDLRTAVHIELLLAEASLRDGKDTTRLNLARIAAEEYGQPEYLGRAYRLIARSGTRTLFGSSDISEDVAPEPCFVRSIEMFRAAGNKRDAAETLTDLGLYLGERGDIDQAHCHLVEALDILKETGATDYSRIQDIFSRLGYEAPR